MKKSKNELRSERERYGEPVFADCARSALEILRSQHITNLNSWGLAHTQIHFAARDPDFADTVVLDRAL